MVHRMPLWLLTLLLIAATAHAQSMDIQATQTDKDLLRRSFVQATKAAELGDHPFAAILGGPNGRMLLKATAHSGPGDCLSHAVMNLCREICSRMHGQDLSAHTVYSNVEPCPMCAAALVRAGVSRVVWGLSRDRLLEITGPSRHPHLTLSARQVLESSTTPVQFSGPNLEEEAEKAIRLFIYKSDSGGASSQ